MFMSSKFGLEMGSKCDDVAYVCQLQAKVGEVGSLEYVRQCGSQMVGMNQVGRC